MFSIGGDKSQYTLANYLSKYNPDLQGASVGNTLPLDAIKWKNHIVEPHDPRIAHLNGAQSQAKIEDVPAQVRERESARMLKRETKKKEQLFSPS